MSAVDQSRRSFAAWVGFLLTAVAAGAAIPSQGRVNSELTAEVDDPFLAALISFSTGLILMLAIAGLTPRGRRTLREVRPALRRGEVRWWYLLAGCIGGYFVLAQSLTIGIIGVAVFTVAVVTGQTLGGLLWDRIGLGPAGRKRLNTVRVLGALLTVLAVLWTVSPQLSGHTGAWTWLLLVIVPLTAGFTNSAQQALNGRQSAAYGSPIPATLINFIAGTAVLVLAYLVKLLVSGAGEALPSTPWFYLGGPLGCVFIGLGAVLVTRVGVLLAAMGMIAGQLIGSLMLDLVAPAPGTVITTATVLGTLLTLVAVVIASLPDIRRTR
ncbi:DMT family transporter [Nesterenkonia xinjiangensis]|uniref:Transporter family-2 protein n=1 Tax=Nesterenkonia xinjiangensis TaxID=225327 RepID=A0A7Z0GMX0_9MICC|nr:DMT family transporter [Nesterenkonia xinjiangensis]NYJ78852.1 transporter family-2 protein [Nesterenkonia xinjiangensis]